MHAPVWKPAPKVSDLRHPLELGSRYTVRTADPWLHSWDGKAATVIERRLALPPLPAPDDPGRWLYLVRTDAGEVAEVWATELEA